MTKFKKLNHPVDEDTFIDYLRQYNNYLTELVIARDAGEDVSREIDEERQSMIKAGIINNDGSVNAMYEDALAYMKEHAV